jgi:hypothetical protein
MAVDDDDVRELRDLYSHDQHEWSDIVKEGDIDMRYAAGDPWESADRQAREEADRPCLNADEISQFLNIAVNDVRVNKRAVAFSPNGRGASEKTAALYADKMREVEYRSQAQVAYTTAFQDAVMRGYGFLRINTRYTSEQSFDQDVWIEPVHNPNLVTPDCRALMPTMSDMEHIWLREAYSHADYNERFKGAKIDDDQVRDLIKAAPQWVDSGRVFVGEHWRKRYELKTLLYIEPQVPAAPPMPRQPGAVLGLQAPPRPMPGLPAGMAPPPGMMPGPPGPNALMPPGGPSGSGGRPPAPAGPPRPFAIFKEEFEASGKLGRVLREREVQVPVVEQLLTNGIEILETNDWPGKYIPFVACLGRVLYLNDTGKQRRIIGSMIRLARDPQMLYAFIVTNEAESFGMAPKFPYFVYEGQLDEANLGLLNNSNKAPVAVIQVRPQIEGIGGDQPVPMPQRNPYDPPAQAYEIAKESARRMIQSAMAHTPLPTAAQRANQKSGKALQKIDEIGQRGSYHFTDHYLDMIQQVGVICEDLFEQVYDGTRTIGARKGNDDAYDVVINDPTDPESVSLSGDHLVTVSTGPSFDSQRDAASDFADTLATMSPQVFALLGPLIVKMKNLGPIGDEMAEMLKFLQPEEVRALDAQQKDGKPPDPKQTQQELAMTKGEMAKMKEVITKMKVALDTDAAKAEASLKQVQFKAQADQQQAQVEAHTNHQLALVEAQTKEYLALLDAKLKAELAQIQADIEAKKQLAETDRQLALQVMKNSAQIAVAHLAAASKGLSMDAHAAEEAQALGHEAEQADLDREQELEVAALAPVAQADGDAGEV